MNNKNKHSRKREDLHIQLMDCCKMNSGGRAGRAAPPVCVTRSKRLLRRAAGPRPSSLPSSGL